MALDCHKDHSTNKFSVFSFMSKAAFLQKHIQSCGEAGKPWLPKVTLAAGQKDVGLEQLILYIKKSSIHNGKREQQQLANPLILISIPAIFTFCSEIQLVFLCTLKQMLCPKSGWSDAYKHDSAVLHLFWCAETDGTAHSCGLNSTENLKASIMNKVMAPHVMMAFCVSLVLSHIFLFWCLTPNR